MNKILFSWFFAVSVLISTSAHAVTYTAIDLGWGTNAYDINDSGQVVGYSYSFDSVNPRAFLYSNGSMQDLGALNGFASVAYGINNAGQVVGHYVFDDHHGSTNTSHAFLYDNGVMQDIGTLSGGPLSSATDINEIGQVTGWSNAIPHVGSNYNAFLFNNGVMQDIGSLNGSGGQTLAESINDSGQIVGESLGLHENHAFLYEQGVMKDLGTLGGGASGAYSINNSGQVVGSSLVIIDSEAVEHAFLYDHGVMVDLGALNNGTSVAFDINDSGQVVGYTNGLAFIYENSNMQDLNLLLSTSIGASLTSATAINSSGQIIAYGSNGHSYILNRDYISPIPEPQTFLMFLSGLGLLGFMALRRKENVLNLGISISIDIN